MPKPQGLDQEDFIKWKLILSKIVTLKELETFWSYKDMIQAYNLLAYREYSEWKYMEESKVKK